ncbi:MAG: ATP phosphoribosyltransferase [Chloroflexi bacterium]|nr:ATP phosphoribosyltransferase [Chloroflexota bacterium]
MSQATVAAMGAALSGITEPGRLRLAIPNKGRMLEPTAALLRDAGLDFEDGTRALVTRVSTFPLDILSVRTDDIAEFVADGVADLGITGTNLLHEADVDLPVHLELGYGRCRLEVAVPSDSPVRRMDGLAGRRIATSHAHSTRRAFADRGIDVEVVTISGAVEVAPRLGLADAIVDLVSTGSTLVMNGLRSIEVLLSSQAVLVGPRTPDPTRIDLVGELLTMLEAVVAGRRVKYLMMNAPRSALEAIEAILPGLESPSVIPLAHEGMVAVHSVVPSDQVHSLLSRLRGAGASGILVVPVEKLLP